MRKIVIDLMQYRAADAYRGSSDESDSVEQIGGLPPIGVADAKRSKYRFSDEQLEAALELLSVNSLPDLARQDFSEFGKKLSWIQLAQGCVTRLAGDVLMLMNVGETAERCALLFHRLENRKAARVRTPNEAQSSIQDLYNASVSINDVWRLSQGKRVGNVERAVGKTQSLMASWRAVQSLFPTTPNTERLVSIVREALSNVMKDANVREGTREMARRALLQWSISPRATATAGRQVNFDSDDE
eukprot:1964-Prymnesium_polylepis.2